VGLRVHPAQGGFYLLLDFSPFAEQLAQRDLSSDSRLCERLLDETGVALLPGSSFGMRSEVLTARMAYVDFDGRAALQAWEANQFLASPHAKKMLQGIAAISNWLHNC
jgi:aspartate/methionine/tyrosine aminotransferase